MRALREYREILLQQIEKQYTLSERVREVFRAVPRHLFLTPPDGVVTEQWLSEVYQDQAITTKRDTRGMPLSSSSQPSVMALMLDALDVQPGMKVLEIGTGTGYNAALLASLTGDPALVTTVDIDPALVALASERIEGVVGTGMSVVTGNGFEGYFPHAPYERIIATASAFPIPSAWHTQIMPGGRLVLDLRGKIGGGLMVVTKQADGTSNGRFLPVWDTISFMGLRETAEGSTRTEAFAVPLLDEQTLVEPGTVEYACAEHFCSYEQFRRVDDGLNLWMQCLFPSLSIKWVQRDRRALALLHEGESQTMLAIEQRGERIGVVVRGTRALWLELVRAYETWLASAQPGQESYMLVVTEEGQCMQMGPEGKFRMSAIGG